jgi:hypothetical protein
MWREVRSTEFAVIREVLVQYLMVKLVAVADGEQDRVQLAKGTHVIRRTEAK